MTKKTKKKKTTKTTKAAPKESLYCQVQNQTPRLPEFQCPNGTLKAFWEQRSEGWQDLSFEGYITNEDEIRDLRDFLNTLLAPAD